MAESSIPVDLMNPGQVFACLGLLELADQFLGGAQGAFDWSSGNDTRFKLSVPQEANPIESILELLASAEIVEIEPANWPEEKCSNADSSEVFPSPLHHHKDAEGGYSRAKLPIVLKLRERAMSLRMEHWTDYSSRPDFKLYAGNRSGFTIARDMIKGKNSKPTKTGAVKLLNPGVSQMRETNASRLATAPFDVLVAMAGSFNFDARGAWTPIDEGYSPDKQKHSLQASPLVEILAVVSMENTRPIEIKRGIFRYAAWSDWLSVELARIALQGRLPCFSMRRFEFALGYSGKNKIVTFSKEIP